jgi:hypothetical protein
MRKLPLALLAAASLSNAGCIKQILTDGQISSTREASGVFDTIGDYELARGAAESGIIQFEGMHRLAPDNTDALFGLAQSWTGYGFAFAEDDMEAAQDKGNDDLTEYHKRRAHMAYDRAVFYGLELLAHRDKGFEGARKNANTMKAWLKANFSNEDDAGNLFWTGYGWMARTNVDKDDPAVVAELFVGESMVERAVEIDPSYNHYNGELALAAYQTAVSNMAEGKKIFEMVLQKTQRKDLMVQFTYAQTWACSNNDRPLYEGLLNEVLAAGDTDPEQRLENAIAKRRARRYLGKERMQSCGFDMSTHAAAPAPPSPTSPAASAPPAPAPAPAAPAKKK